MKVILENWKRYLKESIQTQVYHGSPYKFDFMSYNFDRGVRVIYNFLNKELARQFAIVSSSDYEGVRGEYGWVYSVNIDPSNIVDLTRADNLDQKGELIKKYLLENDLIDSEKSFSRIIDCDGSECMFDNLDYNTELRDWCVSNDIYGLKIYDGLDEIGIKKIEVIVLFSIDPVIDYAVEKA